MSNRFTDTFFAVLALAGLLFLSTTALGAPPANFSQAKDLLKHQVYYDQNKNGALGTIYCGCDWDWVGRSGGRIKPDGCGYEVRAIANRGARTEVEHLTPISWAGQQRQCWQKGGRKNCQATDPVFNRMEADLHNLTYSVGELNADRSNYRFGMLPAARKQHGQCESKVDFKKRVFEPRDDAKGLVARSAFYFFDYYDLRMSEQQQKLMMSWDKQFPVTAWELERDRRIAKVMGHHNDFVTGKRTWRLGHRNSADGVVGTNRQNTANVPVKQTQRTFAQKKTSTSEIDIGTAPIRGNRNSKIFHPRGCSTYSAMSPRNVVNFSSEEDAVAAGYRRAKNCK